MVKIRSLEELEQKFTEESLWRKREIHFLGDLIDSSGNIEIRNAAKRSSIVILYAHWEGWIKNIAQYYIQYVKSKNLKYFELSDAFLANALRVELIEMYKSDKSHIHQEVVKTVRYNLNSKPKIHEEYVDTQSNLSIAVFENILNLIGVDPDPYVSRGLEIDASLLAVRNKIAHGEFYEFPDGEFERLSGDIVLILDNFKDDVLNHAVMEKYKILNSETRS